MPVARCRRIILLPFFSCCSRPTVHVMDCQCVDSGATPAVPLGITQQLMPKGTASQMYMGRIWGGAMLGAALTSFAIADFNGRSSTVWPSASGSFAMLCLALWGEDGTFSCRTVDFLHVSVTFSPFSCPSIVLFDANLMARRLSFDCRKRSATMYRAAHINPIPNVHLPPITAGVPRTRRKPHDGSPQCCPP